MACLLCGLVFNGIASAALQKARPGRAMLNFLTFGTFGQVADGVDSYTQGVMTETLLKQRMVEGFECVLRLLVTADALAVAGSLADVPCPSRLAHDPDKKAIQEREESGHLRPMSSFTILAFHVSEVLADRVVVLFASTTRPWGLPSPSSAVGHMPHLTPRDDVNRRHPRSWLLGARRHRVWPMDAAVAN